MKRLLVALALSIFPALADAQSLVLIAEQIGCTVCLTGSLAEFGVGLINRGDETLEVVVTADLTLPDLSVAAIFEESVTLVPHSAHGILVFHRTIRPEDQRGAYLMRGTLRSSTGVLIDTDRVRAHLLPWPF